MNRLQGLFIFIGLIFFSSCNPKISTSIIRTYSPLDYKQEVVVISLDQMEPENVEVLGEVKIGDTGFSTKCSYDIVIDQAKLEAKKAGGNAIKIIEHKQPTAMGSSCHRITAKILRVENIATYTPKVEEEVLLDVDYAILNIYRYSGAGALVGYDLYLGDSVICRVKNNYKTTLRIKKDGINTLWARTEAKSEAPIDIKMGKIYYVRCGITMGAFVGRPKIELVNSKTGKAEFESFKAKNQ
ncbi:MAG TPA: hypothetical protein DCQ31_18275 [Bacteroidales bacterium]|nr:hypothetical protein [Bacteroidales bacterium]